MKMRKLWPFAFNVLWFAASAFVSPFIVLYYQGLAFSGAQIGVLTGITPLITFVCTPLWTGLADATRRHQPIMNLAMLVGGMALFLFPLLHAFLPVFLIAVVLYVFLAPVTPFVDSATLFMLADEKEMYSRVRLGGTIGYGLAAPIAGMLVQDHGLRVAFWGCATLIFLGLVASQKLIYGQLEAHSSAAGAARTLLSNPRWLPFLIVAFVGGAGLAAFNNYFFPYMKELGANESTMGLALTVGTLSEIPILFFGNRLIKRLKPYGLLMLSMVVTGLRMLLFAVCRTPSAVLSIQLLNGLSFAAFWVAGVSYAGKIAPAGMNTTAQGLFGATVMGFGMAVGGLTGGPLLTSMGGRGLYAIFGAAVLAIVGIVALIQHRLTGRSSYVD
jgi:PPP family 3-phenylpropionic acid transporter